MVGPSGSQSLTAGLRRIMERFSLLFLITDAGPVGGRQSNFHFWTRPLGELPSRYDAAGIVRLVHAASLRFGNDTAPYPQQFPGQVWVGVGQRMNGRQVARSTVRHSRSMRQSQRSFRGERWRYSSVPSSRRLTVANGKRKSIHALLSTWRSDRARRLA